MRGAPSQRRRGAFAEALPRGVSLERTNEARLDDLSQREPDTAFFDELRAA